MPPPAMNNACVQCQAKDRQIADLKLVVQKLQQELRARMSKRALAVIDALDGNGGLIPAEVAKRAKMTLASARLQLKVLKQRGVVRRSGWRDIPDARWPQPEFQLVGARENGQSRPKP